MFRFETGIHLAKRRPGESFLQPRLLKSGGIGESQARAGESFAAAQNLPGQSYTRNAGVAERAVMNQPPTRDHRQPAQDQLLLHINVVAQTLSVRLSEVDVA